jgi:II/X family phage/plasmid replication protein
MRGSYESSIQVCSRGSDGQGRATHLWIDGNISKYLQGHNLFGSRDLIALVYQTFSKLTSRLDSSIHADLSDLASAEQSILSGDFEVKGIDLNQLYDLGNDRSVESWLYAAEMHASRRAGRTTSERGTVYLGKNSRRWAIKFYNKFREMTKHQSKDHPHLSQLTQFADGKLRIELRLLSLELKTLGLTHARQFTTTRMDELFNSYMERIDMNQNAHLIDDDLLNLPRSVTGTYHLWKSGVSIKQMLSEPTYYRHRKILLEHGIDINFPPISPERNNVQPLIRVIEAKPVSNPQWAYDLKLIA